MISGDISGTNVIQYCSNTELSQKETYFFWRGKSVLKIEKCYEILELGVVLFDKGGVKGKRRKKNFNYRIIIF